MNGLGRVLISIGATILLSVAVCNFTKPGEQTDTPDKKKMLKVSLIGISLALAFFLAGSAALTYANRFESRYKADPNAYTAYINGVEVPPESVDFDNYYYQYNEKRKEVYFMPKGINTME